MHNPEVFSLEAMIITSDLNHLLRESSYFIKTGCAFWMLFGGQKIPEKYQGHPWAANYTTTVGGMARPNNLIFSLFRITLVDDYAYDVSAIVLITFTPF